MTKIPSPVPIRDDDFDDLFERLEEMIEDERFKWALDTLTPIRDWGEGNKMFTAQQAQAIKNIRERVEGTSEKKVWTRRYEGHS